MKNKKRLFCIFIISLLITAIHTETIEASNTNIMTETVETAFSGYSGNKSKAKQVKRSRKVQALKSRHYNKKNIRLLASIIYCEAGNQSYSGKLAVGIVVMNRVRSASYPNTVKGVIYQKSQFGPASSGLLKKAIKDYKSGGFTTRDKKQCIRAAKEALKGAKSIKVKNKRKVFSSYYGFNNVKPSCSFYKLGGHYFRK